MIVETFVSGDFDKRVLSIEFSLVNQRNFAKGIVKSLSVRERFKSNRGFEFQS